MSLQKSFYPCNTPHSGKEKGDETVVAYTVELGTSQMLSSTQLFYPPG
jgi:hypothetical protein